MNVFYLQKGLVDWFTLEPNTAKKIRRVENVCSNLYKQTFGDTSSNYKYSIIHPLLKFGVLEYDEESYWLSPSCALYKNSKILLCNIPRSNLLQADHSCVYNSGLGVEVYARNDLINTFLQQSGINCRQFGLTGLFQSVSLVKTIETWPRVKILDTTGYQTLNKNNKWQLATEIFSGVYRTGKEEYARRLIKISENNWRLLSANWNDYPIAVLWSKIYNNYPFMIQYRQQEELLCLNNEFFPLVLERLLLINTLLGESLNTSFDRRQYYLNATEFAMLNKIFNHRIPTI